MLPTFQVCPEDGAFIGWKKVSDGSVIKILIPETARRTSTLVGRKCRAEFVVVLETPEANRAYTAIRTSSVVYSQGATVYPDSYNDDIRDVCTNGIHFFMTRLEAEAY